MLIVFSASRRMGGIGAAGTRAGVGAGRFCRASGAGSRLVVAEAGASRARAVEGRGSTAAAVDALSPAGGAGRRSRADGALSWVAVGLGRTETVPPATANSTR